MKRVVSFALTTVVGTVVGTGCVHNPARHLEPNNEDIVVEDSGALKRGKEVLDEQDFYALVDDKTSATAIGDARGGGETLQAVGIPVAAAGVLTAAGGAAVYYRNLNASEPIGEYDGLIGYGLLFGGIAVTAGGAYLIIDGREKASGAAPMFDVAHARASLEKGLYGGAGATASIIKSLSWATVDGKNTFCSITGKDLAAVVATDERGRAVRMAGRDEWIEYTSNPDGLVLGSGTSLTVRSPWQTDLTGLGNEITVTATVKDTGVSTSLTLAPDFTCPGPLVDYSSVGGSSGSSGGWGSSGSSGGAGGDGGDGGLGETGSDGEAVTVEATTLPFRGKTLIVSVSSMAGATESAVTVHDASVGPLVVAVRGGSGGSGGRGGSGGSGGSGSSECMVGGDGGRGGRGGSGGNGGRGGDVKARVDGDPKELLAIDVSGGSGGGRGDGGSGGGGGSSPRCGDSSMDSGRRGPDGPDGQPGNAGPSGKSDVSKAAKKSLPNLSRVLASAPKN